jgi:hypothetical protein
MAIEGKQRKENEFTLKTGLFEARVIAINPTEEDYKEILGIELKEDSKATEYLGESKEGNTYLRLDVWLEDVNAKEGELPFRQKVGFYLEDKERENKDGSKLQYINNVGVCSWADDPNNLPDWFMEREHRVANVGEEEMYTFLRSWMGKLDTRDGESQLTVEWKKLMKGNVKELKEFMGCEFETTVVALATVRTVEKDGEVKEYQNIYNRAFLPAYALKNFRLVDYSSEDQISKLKAKKPKDRKAHERFVVDVMDGEYGCKDYLILKDLQDYDASANLAASDKVISEKGPDY